MFTIDTRMFKVNALHSKFRKHELFFIVLKHVLYSITMIDVL